MSSFLELAKTRRSVRTFDDNWPDGAVLTTLQEFAENMTNPFGTKIRFAFLNAENEDLSSPVLTGEKEYVTAVVQKGASNLEAAYGYSFEKLLMKAHELGLGTVWIGGTMPRGKFEKASHVEENEVMPCVSPLGKASERMSMKEALMRKGVKADSRLKFEDLFFDENFDTPLPESVAGNKGRLTDALEAVRIAPSAVNKQPWRVVVIDNAAHFYVKHDAGYITPDYDLQKIDVGIALYHFESQLISEGKQPSITVEDPGLPTPKHIDYVATVRF